MAIGDFIRQGYDQFLLNQQQPQAGGMAEEPMTVKGLDPIEHKGMFGVKGTLRDVLGLLGDTYLIANGRDATYGPRRREERASADLAGRYQDNQEENFINNPLLAIQRLAESGYGKQAQELYQDYTKNEAVKQAAQLNEARLNRQELRDAQLAKQGDVKAQRDLQAILGNTFAAIKDQSVLDQFLPIAQKRVDEAGLTTVLPRTVEEAARYGIDAYRSQRLEDFDEGLSNQRRGQDVSAATQRRGQDIRSGDTRRGQDMTDKRVRETGGRGGGRGRPEVPPRAPKSKGDAIRSPTGATFTSPDGKRWVRTN